MPKTETASVTAPRTRSDSEAPGGSITPAGRGIVKFPAASVSPVAITFDPAVPRTAFPLPAAEGGGKISICKPRPGLESGSCRLPRSREGSATAGSAAATTFPTTAARLSNTFLIATPESSILAGGLAVTAVQPCRRPASRSSGPKAAWESGPGPREALSRMSTVQAVSRCRAALRSSWVSYERPSAALQRVGPCAAAHRPKISRLQRRCLCPKTPVNKGWPQRTATQGAITNRPCSRHFSADASTSWRV